MVTDPPYGVSYDPDWRNEAVAFLKGDGTRKVGKVENDDRADWTGAFLLFPGSVAYVWHAAWHAGMVAESIKVAGFEIRTQVVWAKVRPAISRGHYNWQHEPCWYAVRKGAIANWCGDKRQSTLWKIDKPQMDADADRSSLHGTQKPVECMARPIRNHAFESVYDPFVGTGTTIVAAERTGRASFSMELKPSYCEGAIQRIEALTGEERRLVE